uniref:Uncharacterized protein n=1 Tax=Romanomermis culicivorax TaxID=13658 RepID=A0A915I757_ROMCU
MTQLEEAYNKPLRIYSISERQCVTTIGYNPYGENSIMHMAPLDHVIVKRQVSPDGDDTSLQDRKGLNPYKLRIGRPRFEDWFINPLHQSDLNNINRHYQCGEHLSGCRDKLSREDCEQAGLGMRSVTGRSPVMFADFAGCLRDDELFTSCLKTCGLCYQLIK